MKVLDPANVAEAFPLHVAERRRQSHHVKPVFMWSELGAGHAIQVMFWYLKSGGNTSVVQTSIQLECPLSLYIQYILNGFKNSCGGNARKNRRYIVKLFSQLFNCFGNCFVHFRNFLEYKKKLLTIVAKLLRISRTF